jgi:hypothetical protein
MSNQHNSNDWLVNFKKAKESSINQEANYTQFGTQRIYWIDGQGQKHEKDLYLMHEGGKYMEANVVQIRLFKEICGDAGWHGPQRFRNFVDLLGGALKEDWEELMNDGDDNWDPADVNNDDDFDAAITAFLIKVTEESMPGNLQHQRIMETKYFNCKTDNQLVKPSLYWRRKKTMWNHAEIYGRVGAAIEDQAILEAEFHGLPLSAREWLKDEATGDGVDIFDYANGGADMYTPLDLFDLLDKWWKKLPKNNNQKNGKSGKGGGNHERNNDANGNSNRNNDDRKRNHNSNHHERGTKRQKFNDTRGNNTKQPSAFDRADCPIHGGHKWMDCRLAHGKKNFNEQQANNYAQRVGADARQKFAWWFTTHEKKDWWKKNSNSGSTQQQYFGGQPHYHQQQQQQQPQVLGSYYQQPPPPPGMPPAFPQAAVVPPPPGGPSTPSSYASAPAAARPVTKTFVYNPQTGQWM